ncbi:hypothetical protein TA3x_002473 [Tundrisphaera sp. TA3]|uniref:hypothetical protein n=1 Tax=Tundrisphaera sp. TA3 TaxID=3435775 RepID=UPI003EBD05FE
MPAIPLLLAAVLISQASTATPGRRVDLGGEATAFIPEGYRPADGAVDLLIHLHGAPSAVEPALAKFPGSVVLVEVNRKGLSKAYSEPFADRELFLRIIDRAVKAVDSPTPLHAGRVTVSSFSAGFGGVRELLKVPEHFARIDALIMADSIYAGYEGDIAARKVDPGLMAGFRAFARAAAAGEKAMIVTHSAQVPEGYASTTETADDLIRAVDGRPTTARVDWGDGWIQSRAFSEGKFTVIGFEGAGPEDHMRHLRRIGEVWRITPGSSHVPGASDGASPARSDRPRGSRARPG